MFLRKTLGSFVLTSVAAGLVLTAAAGEARAQITGTGGTTVTTGTGGAGGSTFQTSDFFVGVQEFPPVNLTEFALSRFFNKARCDCSEDVNLFISLLASGVAKRAAAGVTQGTVSVVLGTGCSSSEGLIQGQAAGACLGIASEPVLTFLNQGSFTIPTNARVLSTYFNASGTFVDGGTTGSGTAPPCTAPTNQTFPSTVNFNFDFGTGTIQLSIALSLLIDMAPPPPPMGVRIQGGNEALVLNWQAIDTAAVPDLLGYQILCSRADQYQVFNVGPAPDGGLGTSGGPFGANFLTCPATRTGTGVEGSDPTFVCSGLLSAQTTSARVEILQNDITYAAAVVAIDNSGNPSPVTVGPATANGSCGSHPGCFGTPIKTLSFYDVYRDQTPQGQATGGFCALPTARPRLATTLGGLALGALGALGLAIARRRRGPR